MFQFLIEDKIAVIPIWMSLHMRRNRFQFLIEDKIGKITMKTRIKVVSFISFQFLIEDKIECIHILIKALNKFQFLIEDKREDNL